MIGKKQNAKQKAFLFLAATVTFFTAVTSFAIDNPKELESLVRQSLLNQKDIPTKYYVSTTEKNGEDGSYLEFYLAFPQDTNFDLIPKIREIADASVGQNYPFPYKIRVSISPKLQKHAKTTTQPQIVVAPPKELPSNLEAASSEQPRVKPFFYVILGIFLSAIGLALSALSIIAFRKFKDLKETIHEMRRPSKLRKATAQKEHYFEVLQESTDTLSPQVQANKQLELQISNLCRSHCTLPEQVLRRWAGKSDKIKHVAVLLEVLLNHNVILESDVIRGLMKTITASEGFFATEVSPEEKKKILNEIYWFHISSAFDVPAGRLSHK